MRYIFIIMITLFTALVAYTVVRGFQALREFPVFRNIYLVVAVLLFVFLIVGMIMSVLTPVAIPRFIIFLGHSALIIFLYLFVSFLIVDIVRIFNYFFHFAPEGMWKFRQWVFIASIAITAIAMIAGNYKFNHPKIVNLEVTANNSVAQNKEIKIVTASDVHLGSSITKKRLQKYVDMINAQQPDIVLFAGDICDNRLEPIITLPMM